MSSPARSVVLLMLLPACPSGAEPLPPSNSPQADQDRVAVVEPGTTNDGPAVVSEDVMEEKLQEVAARYPDAIIERLAFSDVMLPVDAAESKRLNGYTLVLITSTSQDPTELPPARVYSTCDDDEQDLLPIVSRKRLIEASYGQIVGPFRYDGLYLIPLEVVARGECKLAMDYAKNRLGQVITVFDLGVPADVLVLPATDYPSEAVLRAVVEREYPIVVSP